MFNHLYYFKKKGAVLNLQGCKKIIKGVVLNLQGCNIIINKYNNKYK